MKTTIYYRISRSSQTDYSHLHLEIIEPNRVVNYNSKLGPCENSLEFRWQSHQNCGSWYGNQVHIESKGVAGAIRATKFLKKFCGDVIPAPEDLIAKLESAGIVRCVYDTRVSEFVPITEVKPEDHVRWLALNDNGGCYVSTVAPQDDKATATRRLAKELANYNTDAFEAWVLAGKPAKVDSYSRAPVLIEVNILPL